MPCLIAVNRRVFDRLRPQACRFLPAHLIGLVLLLATALPVFTQAAVTNYVWDGGFLGLGNSRWDRADNWNITTNTAPPANNIGGLTNSIITFSGVVKLTPLMENNYFIRSLVFDSSAGAFTLSSSGSQVLTIGAGGIANQSANRQTIVSGLSLSNSQTWDAGTGGLVVRGNANLGDNALTIAGSGNTLLTNVVQGSGAIIKQGAGNLVLAGTAANTYSGGTTLSGGTITVAKANALGSGPLTVNAGTLSLGSFNQTAGLFSMSGGSVIGTSAILTASAFQFSAGTVGVRLDSIGGLTKFGTGRTTLTGANTFSGGTVINGGTLAVNNTTGSGTGSGNVAINSGGTLAGNGTVSGIVTNSPGGTIAPGNSVGQLNTGSQIWFGGSTHELEISDATATAGVGWDLLNISGTLNILATSGDRTSLDVVSLTLGGTPGLAANFDPTQGYLWRILQTSGGITFAPGEDVTTAFTLLTGGFANALNGGQFGLETGNGGLDLNLIYTPALVPEPQALAFIALAACGLIYGRRFKRLWRSERRPVQRPTAQTFESRVTASVT